jgi:hypothetical protein
MRLDPEVRTRVFVPDDLDQLDANLSNLVAINAVSVERWDPPTAVFDHSLDPTWLSGQGIRFEHWWLFDFTPYGSPIYGWVHEDRPVDWFWKIETTVDEDGLIPVDLWMEIVDTLKAADAQPMGSWIGEIFPFR